MNKDIDFGKKVSERHASSKRSYTCTRTGSFLNFAGRDLRLVRILGFFWILVSAQPEDDSRALSIGGVFLRSKFSCFGSSFGTSVSFSPSSSTHSEGDLLVTDMFFHCLKLCFRLQEVVQAVERSNLPCHVVYSPPIQRRTYPKIGPCTHQE